MGPRAKAPSASAAPPPVTTAKKPARASHMNRAGHLKPVVETDSAAETEDANEVSDTSSISDTTNAEESTGASVGARGGRQVAGAKNAAATKKAPVKMDRVADKAAAAKDLAAYKKASALNVSKASTQIETTEDEGPSEDLDAAKRAEYKKMLPPKTKGRATVEQSFDPMDIDSSEQAEEPRAKPAARSKQQRQPPASKRRGTQGGRINTRVADYNHLASSYPDDFPSVLPLSQTRFQGHGQRLPVVEYTNTGRRVPFFKEAARELREELLREIPYVFHQEREHRLANEALELTREYVSALMYQEMNRNTLIRQHMEDDEIHKKNGVEFSAEEKGKRSDLLEDLKNDRCLQKINYLHHKMKQMEGGLQYFATEAEEKARAQMLKEAMEKKKNWGKGKGKAAETSEMDEEETRDQEDEEVEGQADDESEY